MTQTPATKLALEAQEYLCQWHLHVLHRVRHIFDDYVFGYPPEMAGGHHVHGRGRVDRPETIMALCSECHWKVENAKIPKARIVALMSFISGVDCHEPYKAFCKFTDEEYEEARAWLGNV